MSIYKVANLYIRKLAQNPDAPGLGMPDAGQESVKPKEPSKSKHSIDDFLRGIHRTGDYFPHTNINGFRVSIQAGPDRYSEPIEKLPSLADYKSVEVAILKDGEFIKTPWHPEYDDVIPYMPKNKLADLIDWLKTNPEIGKKVESEGFDEFLAGIEKRMDGRWYPVDVGDFTISIQAGYGMYSSPREDLSSLADYDEFEVAVFKGGEWVTDYSGTPWEEWKQQDSLQGPGSFWGGRPVLVNLPKDKLEELVNACRSGDPFAGEIDVEDPTKEAF